MYDDGSVSGRTSVFDLPHELQHPRRRLRHPEVRPAGEVVVEQVPPHAQCCVTLHLSCMNGYKPATVSIALKHNHTPTCCIVNFRMV